MKTDEQIIWEEYFASNWDYNNYNNNLNDRFNNYNTSSKYSYFNKGQCPTNAGLSYIYTPSIDEETQYSIIEIGNIGDRKDNNYFTTLYILMPTKLIKSSKFKNTQLKSIIFSRVNKFFKKYKNYYMPSNIKNIFYKNDLEILHKNELEKLLNDNNIVIQYEDSDIVRPSQSKPSKLTQMEFDF